jgi:hypothetical protein
MLTGCLKVDLWLHKSFSMLLVVLMVLMLITGVLVDPGPWWQWNCGGPGNMG